MNRNPSNSLPFLMAITGFVNYKTAQGWSQRSVDSYKRILEQLVARFYSVPDTTVDDMVSFLNTGIRNSGLIVVKVVLPKTREWGRLSKATAKPFAIRCSVDLRFHEISAFNAYSIACSVFMERPSAQSKSNIF